MASKKNWIAGAIKKPGALHEQLKVPKGEKIPAKKLAVKEADTKRQPRCKRTIKSITSGS